MENETNQVEHKTMKLLEDILTEDEIYDISETFRLIGDPSRLKILYILSHTEENVRNISAAFDMSPPAVSHHLRLLKSMKIIKSERRGKEVYYTLGTSELARTIHRMVDQVFKMHCTI